MSRPKLAMVRPSIANEAQRASRKAIRVEQGEARLVVELSREEHRSLKSRAARSGKTMRDYVREVLERAGAFSEDT